MTTVVEPTPQTDADPSAVAASIRYAGADYILPTTQSPHAQYDSRISGAPLDAFVYLTNTEVSGGIEVSFDTGEAFIGGHWLARDTESTAVIDTSTSGQQVYLGVDRSQANTLIVGKDGDFPSDAHPRVLIYTFDTDSTSVTSTQSERPLGASNALTDIAYSKNEADDRFLNTTGGGLEDDLDFDGNAALNVAEDAWSSRPDNPAPNQRILRTDTDPQRIEVYTSVGWRVTDLERVFPIIDDFETGDYEPRWNGSFSGTATVTSTAATSGSYGLNLLDYCQLYSMPGDGLANYPERGDSFRGHFRPRDVTDSNQYWYTFAHQDTNFDAFYSAEMTMQSSSSGGNFRIQKRTGTDTVVIDSDTSIPDYVQDRIYRVEIDWVDPMEARLIDTSDDTTVSTVSGSDTQYDTGGVGLRSSGTSEVDVDELEMID